MLLKSQKGRTKAEREARDRAIHTAMVEAEIRRRLCAIVARHCASSMSLWASVPDLAPCDRLDAAATLIALLADVAETYGLNLPPAIWRHRRAVDQDLHDVAALIRTWASDLHAIS